MDRQAPSERPIVWTRATHLVGTLHLPGGAEGHGGRPDTVPTGWHYERIGHDIRLLWRVASALKTIDVRLRAQFDGAGGTLAVVVGGPNTWRACGALRLEIAADGRRAAFWDNGEQPVPLFAGVSDAATGRAEISLRLSDDPPFRYRLDEAGHEPIEGSYAAPLPFRPYAVIPDEIAIVASGGGVTLEDLDVRLGAPRAAIVAFGDSQFHAGRIVAALQARGMPPAVNAGRAGGGTVEALARLESDLLAFRPRHALFWLGGNDLEFARRRGDPPAAGMAGALANIETALTAARDGGAALHVVGALPRGMVEVREFNARLGDLAAHAGVAFHDAYEVLHRRNDKLDIRYSDGLHPNDEGAAMLADWFVAQGLVAALAG